MKYLFFIAVFSIASFCFAQKQTITFIKANGVKTANRDSAQLIRTITDLIPGSNLYGFTENFITGETYRTGKTLAPDYILLDGECTVFYLSGKKLSYTTYDHARPKTETTYFPNGTVYMVSEYAYHTPDPAKPKEYTTEKLITTCNDSTGKTLVTNGNGHFVGYEPIENKYFKSGDPSDMIYFQISDFDEFNNEQGGLKNGKKDGEWSSNDKQAGHSFTETYNNGVFVKGKSIDKEGKEHKYKVLAESAKFKGNLYDFLGTTLKYPADDRAKGKQGRVIVTFVVEKDGNLSDIRVVLSFSNAASDETIRVFKASPTWKPAYIHGIPVRQQFTMPVSFTLANR